MLKELRITYKGTKTRDNLVCSIDSLNKEEMVEVVNFAKELPGIIVIELLEEKEHKPNLGVVRYIDSIFIDEKGQSVTFKWYPGTYNLTIQGNSQRLFDECVSFLKHNYTLIE